MSVKRKKKVMLKKVTLNTVAEKAGLSISSVSQILNNKNISRFPVETRKKVLNTAKRLSYSFKPKFVRVPRVPGVIHPRAQFHS